MSKKKAPTSNATEMSFWDHLEELRWHITKSIIAIVVLGIVAFINRKILFDVILLGPTTSEFITNQLLCRAAEMFSIDGLCMGDMKLQIINITMSGQFLMHLYVSMVAGAILAFPFVLNEIWRFIRPALNPGESKYSRKAVVISSLLFFIGVLFSYYLIVPLTINFLGTYQVSDTITNQISLNSYISTVVSVTFAVGIVFELPLIIYFLTKLGIVTPNFLKKSRKYMLVILLTVSAIITPPDVFSQILVCIPLLILYELSILVSQRLYNKKQKEDKLL